VHAGVVDHPWRFGELDCVPELVTEKRQAGVGLGIELEGDAHVSEGAGRRLQLRRRGSRARQMPAAHVDDEVRPHETLEDGAKGRRLGAAADDGGGQPRPIDTQDRRRGSVGPRRRAAGEQQRGGGQRTPRRRTAKQSGQERRYDIGGFHDESPVRPQSRAARRTSVRERRRRGRRVVKL
jgi:hypothetical protein